MKKITFRRVTVTWTDAISRDGWSKIDDAKEWAKMEDEEDIIIDIGWEIDKTKKYILISPSWCERTKEFDYLKKIPLGTILNISYD